MHALTRTTTRSTTRSTTRTTTRTTALVLAAGLALAGCGSSTSSGHSGHSSAASGSEHDVHGSDDMQGMSGMHGAHEGDPGKGLLATEDGYTLVPTTALTTGRQVLRFRIDGPDGKPVTAFQEDQTKQLHLYLVRGDVTQYLHAHPVLGSDGTWTQPVDVAAPGPYRLYTDFVAIAADGSTHPLVLSVPVSVPGSWTPVPLGPDTSSVTADGLTATLRGSVVAGTASEVTFQVSEDGKPVTDLEQYLDSFAHLTAVHAGDLAYQHVHPQLTAKAGERGGPELPFTVELPEPGRWKLFLQVQRGGRLQLLPFVVTVR
ncbi:MAG: hypothetical protein ACXVFV_00735 [Mycobacteriales bacterium]